MKDKLNQNNNSTRTLEELNKFSNLKEFDNYKELQSIFQLYGRDTADLIYFNQTEGLSSNTIKIQGKEFINFTCYNYLGMSGDPSINKAAVEAIHEYGTSVSASRLVSGEKPIHNQLEKEIAKFLGTEDSITFTAGHATNLGTISFLFNEKDLIIFDELTHNSSQLGLLFSGADHVKFPHNDLTALEKILKEHRHKYEKVLILTEGLFSMDGDIPYLPKLIELKKRFHALLMVDEAHSVGVLGKTGRGICEHFNLNPKEIDILMGTLSKSLGSCGGYIAGSKELVELLKYKCGSFVYSAGMSPANTASALAALKLIQKEPHRVDTLNKRSSQLLHLLKKAQINTGDCEQGPIIPVIVHDPLLSIQTSLILRQKGVYTLPLFYPVVKKNEARLRFFVNSTHTEEQIETAAKHIIDTVKS